MSQLVFTAGMTLITFGLVELLNLDAKTKLFVGVIAIGVYMFMTGKLRRVTG